MENNKAYLQKIHWVFLLAIGYSVLFVATSEWMGRAIFEKRSFLLFSIFHISFLFAALGIITSKWKETLIAGGIGILILVAEFFLLPDKSMSLKVSFLRLLLSYIPLFVFMVLSFGFNQKLLPAILLIIAAVHIRLLADYSQQGLDDFLNKISRIVEYRRKPETLFYIISAICRTAVFVFQIILLFEVMNYLKGNKYAGKTFLLNLGNEYKKINSLIVFWVCRVMFIVFIAGTASFVKNYAYIFGRRLEIFQNKNTLLFFRYMGIFNLIIIISTALFFAWYLRKFLLEYFITYNIRSKFLYWLLLLPFIGLIAFVIINADAAEQKQYNQKVNTIGQFAASSAAAVTTLFFIGYTIRLMSSFGGETIYIIYAVTSILLLIWLMASKAGYYVTLSLNVLFMAACIAAMLFVKSDGPPILPLFPFVLASMIQMVLIFPIYHFDEFEYIPAENPIVEMPENAHLFG
jgi:hypothetical protein